MDETLILPIKSKMDLPFERQIRLYLVQANIKMPTVSEAELLRAAAGRREDQKFLAEYVVGMIWLSWRFERAKPCLASALQMAANHLTSDKYLKLTQQINRLGNLPLFPVARARWQSRDDLEHEASVITYLKTGRKI